MAPLARRQIDSESATGGRVVRDQDALRGCRGDPIFRTLLGRARLGERGVAVLTLVAGFGVLTTWYLAGLIVDPAARGRRGPFEYYSASLGDLVLLPLLNAAAVLYARRILGGLLVVVAATRHHAQRLSAVIERAYNARFGLAFALAVMGVATALEYMDEVYGVARSWTVPEWGRLGPAAVYHQALFACEALIVGFLIARHAVTTRLLLRLARDDSRRATYGALAEQSLRLYGWALLGWGAFVALRVMDFFHVTQTVSASALIALPAPVVTTVAYYVLLIVTGIVPTTLLARRYGLGWMRPHSLLVGASLVAPLAGPAVRILLARLFAI